MEGPTSAGAGGRALASLELCRLAWGAPGSGLAPCGSAVHKKLVLLPLLSV